MNTITVDIFGGEEGSLIVDCIISAASEFCAKVVAVASRISSIGEAVEVFESFKATIIVSSEGVIQAAARRKRTKTVSLTALVAVVFCFVAIGLSHTSAALWSLCISLTFFWLWSLFLKGIKKN